MTEKRKPISYATRQWVKERDKYRCVDCNTHENLTVDHIIPVAHGGTNEVENLTTRCQSCNSKKGCCNGPRRAGGGKVHVTDEGEFCERTDRLNQVARMKFDPKSLVGSFFLGDYERCYQGCVVAEISPGVYLVETFDWLIGASHNQLIFHLHEMKGWTFYDDPSWLTNAYENGVERQWEYQRKKAAERKAESDLV